MKERGKSGKEGRKQGYRTKKSLFRSTGVLLSSIFHPSDILFSSLYRQESRFESFRNYRSSITQVHGAGSLTCVYTGSTKLPLSLN